ncbi:hypothetical protein BCR43DRAFT_453649 [Syncephalastrum racemosum]|uniref:C2H2-type domain-containing protein n=1 Tax=Syncephalastrum racemosum TaxID=13706 RepID=A0A1X2HPD3_SYNRA|nr:hypothetical protein BCR43DRAFT_453649 [Syncephalastrum racemosum]
MEQSMTAMSAYHPDTPPQPEKLPSITMLPSLEMTTPPLHSNDFMNAPVKGNLIEQFGDHTMQPFLQQAPGQAQFYSVSPPLTPAVSPAAFLDSFEYNKRKFSVDVGPFAFNAQSAFDQDELYRRSSACSAMSFDDAMQHQNYAPFIQGSHDAHHDHQQEHQKPLTLFGNTSLYPPSPNQQQLQRQQSHEQSAASKSSRRKSTRNNADHKHICKYPYCGWSFKRYEHLKRHMLVHTGERPHMCQFPGCGKSFSRSDNFHAHCRTHAKKGGNSRRSSKKTSSADPAGFPAAEECSQPSADFSLVSMNIYEDPHADVNAVYSRCSSQDSFDVPSDTFQQQQQQQQQQYIPMTSGPFVPPTSLLSHEQGQASFFMPSPPDLPQYYLPEQTLPVAGASTIPVADSPISTDCQHDAQQKTHVCPMPQCQRRFKRLEHLKRHMRIHTHERPFACNFPNCTKTFSRSDNLSQHMKTHQRHEKRRRQRNIQEQQQEQSGAWSPASSC